MPVEDLERYHSYIRESLHLSEDEPMRFDYYATKIDELQDKVEGLEADLDNAVETAYNRGAIEWTRLNYPIRFRLMSECGRAPAYADVAIIGALRSVIASIEGLPPLHFSENRGEKTDGKNAS